MLQNYRVDENNRLVIRRRSKILRPEGKFIVAGVNRLSYLVKEPLSWKQKYAVADRIDFKGNWAMNENHDLIFTLCRSGKNAKEKLYFKSELLSAQANKLLFSLVSRQNNGVDHIYFLKLEGLWQADNYNRLCFAITKNKNDYDTLVFNTAWQVDKNNTLTYTYEKTYLKKKERIRKKLTFDGFWEISAKNQLAYQLGLEDKSVFCFKVSLGTPSILGKAGTIQYRVGIGIKNSRSFSNKTITLFGVWKFSKDLGLSFEMDYGGKIKTINFCVTYRVGIKNNITFALKNPYGQELGFTVTFDRKFFEDNARLFLRLNKQEEEIRVEAGIDILW
jgi:hypothetical protein